MTARQVNWNGMNWINPSTRLAIYLRDGLSCAYCGAGIEHDGVRLTLDHIIPASKGGSNKPSNLITACNTCNCSRGDRPVSVFAGVVAQYKDGTGATTAEDIMRHIRKIRARKLPRRQARAMLALRGTVAKVIAERLGE